MRYLLAVIVFVFGASLGPIATAQSGVLNLGIASAPFVNAVYSTTYQPGDAISARSTACFMITDDHPNDDELVFCRVEAQPDLGGVFSASNSTVITYGGNIWTDLATLNWNVPATNYPTAYTIYIEYFYYDSAMNKINVGLDYLALTTD
jgi:hypothetical protein